MYYLAAILSGLITLSVFLYRYRDYLPPRVRVMFWGRAPFAHMSASMEIWGARGDFAAGVQKRDGEFTSVIYPEWLIQYVIDLNPDVFNSLPN